MDSIVLSSASKSFFSERGKLNVLNELNVSIKKNEFVSIIGHSGSGKTTLLKMISGLEKPSSGEVFLANALNKKVPMVFQEHCVFPWLNLKENVAFVLSQQKIPFKEREEIISGLLKVINLEDFSNEFPSRLSGGMRQRLAIAMVLASNSDLILFDEPFASLDQITREKMQDFLIQIFEKQRKTILFVTHSLEEAIYLSDRILFIDNKTKKISIDFKINFPRPRNPEIKFSRKFQEIRKELLSLF